jgi:hypothetical protein
MLQKITVYFQWLPTNSGNSTRHDCNMVDLATFQNDFWKDDCWAALRAARNHQRFELLLPFLERGRLSPQFAVAAAHFLRELILEKRITPPKRKRGRPRDKAPATERAEKKIVRRGKNRTLYLAVRDVERLMDYWREHGRKYRIEAKAIEAMAILHGVKQQQIIKQRRMSFSDPRKL